MMRRERGATKKRKSSGASGGLFYWSREEELLIKKLWEEGGLQWEEISNSFPGRSKDACLKRYSTHLKEGEKLIYVSWTKEECLLLRKLRDEDGMTFKEITKSFPGRTADSCNSRCNNQKKKGIAPSSNRELARSSNSARRSRDILINNRDCNDVDNTSSDEDDSDEVVAASESPSSPAPPLDDDDVLPPVISSSSAGLTYYPPPLPRRSQRRKFSSSGARRDEKLIKEFVCFICSRLIFRAQVMRPCGCHVFCEECVPPIDSRTSACFTCSTPFEQALPYRTGNNIAEQMVRARFVKADVSAEWKSRGVEYKR
jgi:hypothetical protein